MRLRSISIVLLLLLLAGVAALFLFSRFFREQPLPYVLVEPPAWLPPRALPMIENTTGNAGGSAEVQEPAFGARKALRMATLRNDDAQAAGFAALSVFERGSRISLEVFLPPLRSGDGYDASLIMDDGSAVALGSPSDRGDGWHALQKDLPASHPSTATSFRITARTPQEPLTNGLTVVDAPFFDAMN